MIPETASAPENNDDPNVGDDEPLLRRVKRHQGWFSTKDGSLTALAFLDRTPGGLVSVHRRELRSAEDICKQYPDVGLAEVLARIPRAYDHNVRADALEDDPSHTVLAPRATLTTGEKRKEAARRIAKAAVIIVPVPEPLV